MWFKNLFCYRFTRPFTLSADELDARLSERATRSVGALEPFYTGWAPPLGRLGRQNVHVTNGCTMICASREEKIMPAAAVREVVEARAAEIEEKEGRKVRNRERLSLKDDVVLEMLPRAFTKSSRTFAYIDTRDDTGDGWLIVDAGSARKADELTGLLRETLGSLSLVPLAVAQAPGAVMTDWLDRGAATSDLVIEDECDLREPEEDGGTVRIRKQDLFSEEIRAHLTAGKRVARLGLTFDDRISFVLDEGLALKRLRFLELIQNESSDLEAETAAERFDGDFAIMNLELSRMLNRLVEALGGYAELESLHAA